MYDYDLDELKQHCLEQRADISPTMWEQDISIQRVITWSYCNWGWFQLSNHVMRLYTDLPFYCGWKSVIMVYLFKQHCIKNVHLIHNPLFFLPRSNVGSINREISQKLSSLISSEEKLITCGKAVIHHGYRLTGLCQIASTNVFQRLKSLVFFAWGYNICWISSWVMNPIHGVYCQVLKYWIS